MYENKKHTKYSAFTVTDGGHVCQKRLSISTTASLVRCAGNVGEEEGVPFLGCVHPNKMSTLAVQFIRKWNDFLCRISGDEF